MKWFHSSGAFNSMVYRGVGFVGERSVLRASADLTAEKSHVISARNRMTEFLYIMSADRYRKRVDTLRAPRLAEEWGPEPGPRSCMKITVKKLLSEPNVIGALLGPRNSPRVRRRKIDPETQTAHSTQS